MKEPSPSLQLLGHVSHPATPLPPHQFWKSLATVLFPLLPLPSHLWPGFHLTAEPWHPPTSLIQDPLSAPVAGPPSESLLPDSSLYCPSLSLSVSVYVSVDGGRDRSEE